MRGSVLISFLGMSLATAGMITGCGDDTDEETPAPAAEKSEEGESCASTNDCAGDLKCYNFVCAEDPNASGGTGGGGGGEPGSGGTSGKGGSSGGSGGKGGTGASTGGTGTAPVLGGLGETCSSRADCAEPYGCFNQRCSEAPIGEGGGGNIPTPTLGGIGETCVLSTDCEVGLSCQPSSGAGSVGVCTPSETGIVPTRATCEAECKTPQDCCELPRELHVDFGESCAELIDRLTEVDCSNPGASSNLCFAKQVYCDCATTGAGWGCTNGACTYTADCSLDGAVMDGCPTTSRSGRPLVSDCDAAGSMLCELTATTAPCTDDVDCDGDPVFDFPADVCEPGECTCYNRTACYRKCDEDLDCAFGKVCDLTGEVCVPAESCDNDTTCQTTMGDFRATCDNGTCTIPCEVDLDCNEGFPLIDGTLKNVCHEGTCQVIGCASDNECRLQADVDNVGNPDAQANPRRMFCTVPMQGAFARPPSSAITD